MAIEEAIGEFINSPINCVPKTLRVYRAALDKLVRFMRWYGANHRVWMDERDWAKAYTANYLLGLYRRNIRLTA